MTEIPLPDEALQGHAGDAFVAVGEEFKRHLVELGGMTPRSSVLDIGCGTGRMARPLAPLLTNGRYCGFDVFAPGIRWCQEQITGRYPNFEFVVADVDNGLYRKDTGVNAATYRFPYPDQSFDVALAASVFTHLMPDEFSNYMRECARVLRSGGRALLTCFLINADSRYMIRTGQTRQHTFEHHQHPYYADNAECPEAAIAYDDGWAIEQVERSGLRIDGGIRFGFWCGRKQFLSYQDIIVVARS